MSINEPTEYNILSDLTSRFRVDEESVNLYSKFLINLPFVIDSLQDLGCTTKVVKRDGKDITVIEHILSAKLLDGNSFSFILTKESGKRMDPFKIEGVFFTSLGDFYHVKNVFAYEVENTCVEAIRVDFDFYSEKSCKAVSDGKFVYYDDFLESGIAPDFSKEHEFWLPLERQWATVPSLMVFFSQREKGPVRVMETKNKKEDK